MKIGLLLCDDVMLHLQTGHRNYPEMFAAILHRAEPGLELVCYRIMDQDYPADIDECDGYIISGSRYSVNDDEPWIRRFEEYVRRLHQHKKPVVGICFGHQMIAKALGGQVSQSDKGWGVGINSVTLASSESWIKAGSDHYSLVVSHQDQVDTLPPGSKVLASNDFCPIAMFVTGDNFLGIQGHPEFSRAYSFDLMEARRDRIPDEVITAGQSTLRHPTDSDKVTLWLLSFLRQAASASGAGSG